MGAKSQTKESIRAAADKAGIGGNIKFLGTITDNQELGAIYRASNVHVFPVRIIPGDPEGFGINVLNEIIVAMHSQDG